jgi:hypothetical protein
VVERPNNSVAAAIQIEMRERRVEVIIASCFDFEPGSA